MKRIVLYFVCFIGPLLILGCDPYFINPKGPRPTPTPTPLPVKRMFVTSLTYAPNFGGLIGGDAICSNRAAAAALQGKWVAFLSTSTVNAITRIPNARWVRLDGKTVFNSTLDIANELAPLATLNLNEFGQLQTYQSVWTGSAPGGLINTLGYTCQDWTSAATNDLGIMGQDDSNNNQYWLDASNNNCSFYNHCLYCFEK